MRWVGKIYLVIVVCYLMILRCFLRNLSRVWYEVFVFFFLDVGFVVDGVDSLSDEW